MTRTVDDHFLMFEGRVEVGNDADEPAGCVGLSLGR